MKASSTILLIILTLMNSCAQNNNDYQLLRKRMVDNQIVARGVNDPSTIRALRKVERHRFVPDDLVGSAYNDSPLPIGYDQTISQPYIVAIMTELSKPTKGKTALEIGTGSGYQAAVLAEIVDSVYTIEIIPQLAASARIRLLNLGYNNVIVMEGDGYKGWPEHAPFDIIIVTAACNHVPQPLIDQLNEGGRLLMPLGNPSQVQDLILVEKINGKIEIKTITRVLFVPFTRKNN